MKMCSSYTRKKYQIVKQLYVNIQIMDKIWQSQKDNINGNVK
jgi:hypothetical protein